MTSDKSENLQVSCVYLNPRGVTNICTLLENSSRIGSIRPFNISKNVLKKTNPSGLRVFDQELYVRSAKHFRFIQMIRLDIEFWLLIINVRDGFEKNVLLFVCSDETDLREI